jgi:hypothetical protein
MPFVGKHREARCRDADHEIGLGVRLLGQQFGGDDAGRVPDPLDLDIRIGLAERVFVSLDLIGFERGVDEELRFLRGSGAGDKEARRHCHDSADASEGLTPVAWNSFHVFAPSRLPATVWQ